MNNKFKWWEAESFAFVRVPKTILSNPVYKGLSANAALLYGILLDRMSLSVKNKGKFTDRYGDVFVYCTLKDIFKTFSCGHDKATKMLRGFLVSETVIMIVYGDESNAEKWKYLFDIFTGIQIITPETAEVFDNDAVRSSCFHIFDHLLEARSFKSRTAEALVNSYRILPKFGML